MTRYEILSRLLDLRNDGLEKDERILLVEQEIEESDMWDSDELKEVDFPEPL